MQQTWVLHESANSVVDLRAEMPRRIEPIAIEAEEDLPTTLFIDWVWLRHAHHRWNEVIPVPGETCSRREGYGCTGEHEGHSHDHHS